MIDTRVIVVASAAYLALLFAIAYFGDRRADRGRSIISNGYIYALSIGVYASSWTYYGSVGRAATTGDRDDSHAHDPDADRRDR